MALTLGGNPSEVITNAPEFDVTTSLTEGASYQNLRIRATIYIGGETEAVAVLEQPKGLDDWDFFDILKSFCGKCNVAAGGSDGTLYPTLSSELLTGWTQYNSNFSTFTTSGREITSAITSGGGGEDWAQSNDLGSAAIGDVYVIAVDAGYSDAGTFPVLFEMEQSGDPSAVGEFCGYSGNSGGRHQANHIYYFVMPYADTTPYIFLGGDAEGTNFSGNFSIKKISDFKGNPGIFFVVKFQEVYENASDVTTIGATRYSQSYLFAPVHVPVGDSFTDYLISTSGKRYCAKRRENVAGSGIYGVATEFISNEGMEVRIMGLCVNPFMTARIYSVYGGNDDDAFQCAGWFIHVVNDNTHTPTAADTFMVVQHYSLNEARTVGQYTGSGLYVWRDQNCYPDVRALSFVGDLGEETLLFRGLHTELGVAEKSYYQNVNRIRKILKAYRSVRHRLRMLYERRAVRELLHELIYTDGEVWMYDSDFTDGYREVTVVDDEVIVSDRNELFDSEIEVEYYE